MPWPACALVGLSLASTFSRVLYSRPIGPAGRHLGISQELISQKRREANPQCSSDFTTGTAGDILLDLHQGQVPQLIVSCQS